MALNEAPPAVDVWLDAVTETPDGQPVDYRIPVTAYPSDSGVLLVNSPGSGELKDGREGRWRKLARHLQALGLCSMVTYNVPRPDFQVQLEWEPYSYRGASWNRILIESAGHAVDWAWRNAEKLGGRAAPEMYLAGFSSGASAVGAVAWQYPQVRRLLLLSAYDSVGEPFYEGLSQFAGDIYMGYGADDPPAGLLAYVLSLGPLAANSFQARQVPGCDHRFSGGANSRALVKAFYWMLQYDETFPNPENAPQLYG